MTTLGKILVFVNLVFSLVTGALIVMVFVTRTNWKAGFETLKQRYDAAVANAETWKSEIDKAKKNLGDSYTTLKQEYDGQAKKLTEAQDTIKAREADVTAQTNLVAKANNELTRATEDLNRRKEEVSNLQKGMAAKDQAINKLDDLNKDLRDRAVAAEINYKDEHERNSQLLTQLERRDKELERLQASKTGAAGAVPAGYAKKPPQDVKGTILASNPKSGLVTLSIGSDSGLSVGNTLEVYRLDPPQYVGMVRVVDVDFKQAVARAQMPLAAGPIKEKDIVASHIATPR
jgi:hypothetical protein